MTCQVEQIADCGDILTIARALFIPEKEDIKWLTQCKISLSSCGNLLAIGYKNRLCLLTTQWISSTDSNTYLISWSGTLPGEITAILALPICPSQSSSQNGPDWFCIIVGFKNGSVGFYTNTGHLLLLEKLDDKAVMKISCHTGTYGTLPDDIHILLETGVCIVTGETLFPVLRNAKAQVAKVQAGIQDDYNIDSRSINIKKWNFNDQDVVNDASVVGIELKNSYDHLLAASTYGGYDTWYRSVPPINTLILGAGVAPYVGFHYALEGGTAPPLQDVARAVANKIKSALPGWLGGGSSEGAGANAEPKPTVRSEALSLRAGLRDASRRGATVCVAPDRRLAAITDGLGRVAVLDVQRGHLVRLFKGYRDAQCAFVQLFDVESSKKPQLSVIKDIKRAIFLIIYNPKKGLIDIRLMQRGNRVAVFTATKNAQLLYNTCGLVGAEKNFSHKRLNLPEFQCVLIDPDGKLKRFNIPFFYALEGDNSQRSKDMHTLRELREYIKKTPNTCDEFESEILTRVSSLQTLEIKKHCLDIFIRKYEISPKVITRCIEIFWDSMNEEKPNELDKKIKYFFAKLGLLTLFFRHINNENTEDMEQLVKKIHEALNLKLMENPEEDEKDLEFHLIEDDTCILERLLLLTQESGYKDHHQVKVKFAEDNASTYKEFISCFVLDEESKHVSLKPDTPVDKLNNVASDTFKLIFKVNDFRTLTNFVRASNIEPKGIAKLLIMHVMNMPLEEISIALAEKFIAVLYYVCRVTKEATYIVYNEISPWWQHIRDMLVDMPCPMRSMVVAMTCKAVCNICENKCLEDDEAWVSLTKENTQWSMLIGKLEDISLLTIILMFKEAFHGKALPTLPMNDFNINLKYIYARGTGSVTELIAKWLCGMGIPPEAIVVNELMDFQAGQAEADSGDEDSTPDLLFVANNRGYIDDNLKVFKWLSLLRRQFPLSTKADYIIANMCWEYAMTWQKCTIKTEYLYAVLQCLNHVTNSHIRVGLFSIIWATYMKHVFEVTCRLVNKVGRLPKDPLCLQDLGLSNANMLKFLEISTNYLNDYMDCLSKAIVEEKQIIQFEKIWNESAPSLVEIAQDTKKPNNDILNLNYQIACTMYYLCHFNVKYSKPLDTLFDIDFQYIFDALTGTIAPREISMKPSEKVRSPRMKFLTKLVRGSIDTITVEENDTSQKMYNDKECMIWIERITNLAELWNVDTEFINKQQTIALYHVGYDALSERASLTLGAEGARALLPPLLAITGQRLKRHLTHTHDQAEWIATVPPLLYNRLQNMAPDPSIPAHPSLETTKLVLQRILYQMGKTSEESPDDKQNIKLAELMIEACDVLIRRKL